MQLFPPTVILRHRRENLKKCSLRGLEGRKDLLFFKYPTPDFNPDAWRGVVVLRLDAPPLTEADNPFGLFLVDATWRYAEKMLRFVEEIPDLKQRSLPSHYRTAYPRRQEDCQDPEKGLASVEALFLAYKILGRDTTGLLDHYYWKNDFLSKNGITIDLE